MNVDQFLNSTTAGRNRILRNERNAMNIQQDEHAQSPRSLFDIASESGMYGAAVLCGMDRVTAEFIHVMREIPVAANCAPTLGDIARAYLSFKLHELCRIRLSNNADS